MRVFKLVGVMLVALAFSAVAVATASAAEVLWRWLPGGEKGATFTGKSGKATLQVKEGLSITAPSSKTTAGAFTEGGQTLGTALIAFEKATTAGLPVNSLGDTSGIILVPLSLHNCMIKKEDNGVRIKISTPLHLEVPSTKLLLVVEGAIIALVSGAKGTTFTLTVAQKGGVQAIEKCEGAAADSLKTSIDSAAFIQSGQEAAEGSITFSATQELMES